MITENIPGNLVRSIVKTAYTSCPDDDLDYLKFRCDVCNAGIFHILMSSALSEIVGNMFGLQLFLIIQRSKRRNESSFVAARIWHLLLQYCRVLDH
jgi:hypothetical protein